MRVFGFEGMGLVHGRFDSFLNPWIMQGPGLILLFFRLFVATATGQTVDYGKGFDKLHAFGLPRVGQAAYVKLECHDFFHELNLDLYLTLTGNAWLLHEDKQGSNLFLIGACQTIDLFDRELVEKKMRELSDQGVDQRSIAAYKRSGSWRPADMEKDLQFCLDFFGNLKKENNDANMLEQLHLGRIFLFAAHTYEHGYKEQANALTRQLFELAGDPRLVIAEALNHLADAQYEMLYKTFTRDGKWDWSWYRNKVARLLDRFPTWPKKGAKHLLLKQIEYKITHPNTAQTDTSAWPAQHRALLDQLLQADEQEFAALSAYMLDRELWIIPAPEKADNFTPTNVVEHIQAAGLSALPMLIALIEDDTLLPMDKVAVTHMNYASSSSGDMDPEIRTRIQYQNMHRPISLADIALQMTPIVFPQDSEYVFRAYRDDRELLVECLEDWYSVNKDKSLDQLALFYLEKGHYSQRKRAIAHLLHNSGTNHFNAIETFLLDNMSKEHEWHMDESLLTQYVAVRGAEAAPFITRIAAKKEALIERMAQQMEDERAERYVKQMKQNHEHLITNLRNLTSPLSLRELLDQIATGEKKVDDVRQLLQLKFAKIELQEAVGALLAATRKAENTSAIETLLQACLLIFGPESYGLNKGKSGSAYDPLAHARDWTRLLSDTRKLDDKNMPVAEYSAMMLDSLCNRDEVNWFVYNLIPDRVAPVVAVRCRELLAGKKGAELTPWPSADRADTNRMAVIVAQLEQIEPGNARALLDQVEPNVWLALYKTLTDDDLEHATALHTNLLPASLTITKITIKTDDPAITGLVATNEPLTRAMIDRIFAWSETMVRTGDCVRVDIRRQAFMRGVAIHVETWHAADATPKQDRWFDRQYRSFLMFRRRKLFMHEMGMYSKDVPFLNAQAHVPCFGYKIALYCYPKEGVASIKKEDDAGDDLLIMDAENRIKTAMEKMHTELWETVDNLFTPAANPLARASVNFQGVSRPKKKDE